MNKTNLSSSTECPVCECHCHTFIKEDHWSEDLCEIQSCEHCDTTTQGDDSKQRLIIDKSVEGILHIKPGTYIINTEDEQIQTKGESNHPEKDRYKLDTRLDSSTLELDSTKKTNMSRFRTKCVGLKDDSMKEQIQIVLDEMLNNKFAIGHMDVYRNKLYALFQSQHSRTLEKTITRFEIVLDRMRACEEEHPDTHKVSLIEIPGWIEELEAEQKGSR